MSNISDWLRTTEGLGSAVHRKCVEAADRIAELENALSVAMERKHEDAAVIVELEERLDAALAHPSEQEWEAWSDEYGVVDLGGFLNARRNRAYDALTAYKPSTDIQHHD